MSGGSYFIKEIKCGETEGGVACGPCSGATVISIRCIKDNEEKWINLTLFSGCTMYMITEEDIFDNLMDESYVEENTDMLESIIVKDIDGIDVSDDFPTINECIAEQPDNKANPLMHIFEALSEYDDEERRSFIDTAIGRYAEEIEIQ